MTLSLSLPSFRGTSCYAKMSVGVIIKKLKCPESESELGQPGESTRDRRDFVQAKGSKSNINTQVKGKGMR